MRRDFSLFFLSKSEMNCKNFLFRNLILPNFSTKKGAKWEAPKTETKDVEESGRMLLK